MSCGFPKCKWKGNSKVGKEGKEGCAWTNFMLAWSTTTTKNAQDKFHWNFVVGLRVHPLFYKGVNLGISTTK